MWLHFIVNVNRVLINTVSSHVYRHSYKGLFSRENRQYIRATLHPVFEKNYLGCLFSHFQWHDVCSLHQCCMSNSPGFYFSFLVLKEYLTQVTFHVFFVSKNRENYNYICDIKCLIIGGNVSKFNAVLQMICRKQSR